MTSSELWLLLQLLQMFLHTGGAAGGRQEAESAERQRAWEYQLAFNESSGRWSLWLIKLQQLDQAGSTPSRPGAL